MVTRIYRDKEFELLDGVYDTGEDSFLLVDAALNRIPDPADLACRLSSIPGVVEHGLFIGIAQTAIIAGAAGVQVIEKDKTPKR